MKNSSNECSPSEAAFPACNPPSQLKDFLGQLPSTCHLVASIGCVVPGHRFQGKAELLLRVGIQGMRLPTLDCFAQKGDGERLAG